MHTKGINSTVETWDHKQKLLQIKPITKVSVMCLTILALIYVSLSFQFDRQTLSIALRFLRAKTPEQRAAVDLDTHYSQVKINILDHNSKPDSPLFSSSFICLFCFEIRMHRLIEIVEN